jgi:predicted alpha/beta-fold hydrolase
MKASSSHVLDCGEGVRLQGHYSSNDPGSRDLCILIHGWLGSSESTYLLSAASHLWNRGYDIFRLNLRDHGGTHALNEGLFHSCRVQEVVGAVRSIQQRFPHARCFLAGFSLGGNFALRVAVRAPDAGIRLHHAVGVCPVLYPPSTMAALETGPHAYHLHLMRKWQRSLRAKKRAFPHLKALDHAPRYKALGRMTDYFVRELTDYPDLMTYLKGYAITGDALSTLAVPSTIIASLDDPLIPAPDLRHLAAPDCLRVETHRYGGHCGFVMNGQLKSWADSRMEEIFRSSA